jgi:hypothetical protein
VTDFKAMVGYRVRENPQIFEVDGLNCLHFSIRVYLLLEPPRLFVVIVKLLYGSTGLAFV